ncbi:uncharacterized protein KQ657_001621 [Scheffersomyces spartinae]|uniref:N-acetyltransferase domain-containing protein n=1 Tax=Scheffersomyces spartinae TaxID=45513 RepID=A0A9P7V7A3_9ASCO|nr:uncharacterized protein KQ657_001621 [Scheffersomyces spartinae]KAG7192526.1 hypothetical protein KQ657_001621 [Scheffersomyces spartinae]
MSDFPPNLCIRPLTVEDVDQSLLLEKALFPEGERCSPETIKYRLTVCPELCSGLFIREYIPKYKEINLPEIADKQRKEVSEYEEDSDDDHKDIPGKTSVIKETLIGHVLATKINGSRITNESMELPRKDNELTGHHELSRTIGVHSVCISPSWKGKNLGTLMLHDYVQKLSNQDLGDQIVIIVHAELIKFYSKIGFVNLGISQCNFSGSEWYDMAIDLVREDD